MIIKQKSGYNACILHLGENAIHCSREEGFLLPILPFHHIKNTRKTSCVCVYIYIFMKRHTRFFYTKKDNSDQIFSQKLKKTGEL